MSSREEEGGPLDADLTPGFTIQTVEMQSVEIETVKMQTVEMETVESEVVRYTKLEVETEIDGLPTGYVVEVKSSADGRLSSSDEVVSSADGGFWEEFLGECRAFENCTIYCQDRSYRTHKLLLIHNPFLRHLLSREDAGDESAIFLPDFPMEEVQEALQFNTRLKTELTCLLNSCFAAQQNSRKKDSVPELPKGELDDVSENERYLEKFQCDKCEGDFDTLRGLFAHLQTVHGEAMDEEAGQTQSMTWRQRPKGKSRRKHKNDLDDFVVDEDEEEEEDDDFDEDDVDEEDEEEEDDEESNQVAKKKTPKPRRSRVPKNTENGERNSVCKFCGKRFSIPKYLDSHITNKHPEKSEIISFIKETDGAFQCTLCQKSFTIARRCRYHLKFKHKIGAKFSCDQCKKKFYYEYDLELHKRFHGSKRNFVCDLCGKGFLMENVLQNHMYNMHSSREEKEKGRKFVCSYCAKGFFSKSALQEHEFLHSENKNFHCFMCGLSFKQSSGLRAHNNRHHSEAGPKPITEEHKEKMRAYMKKYRAIKAGKLPDNINHTFRSPRKNTGGASAPAQPPAAAVLERVVLMTPSTAVAAQSHDVITFHPTAFKMDGQHYQPRSTEKLGRIFYIDT